MTSSIDLVISEQAHQDIQDIYQYTFERWGPEQADRYELAIHDALKRLQVFPDMGRLVDSGQRIHTLPVRSHVVVYQRDEHRVVIVRVAHHRQESRR